MTAPLQQIYRAIALVYLFIILLLNVARHSGDDRTLSEIRFYHSKFASVPAGSKRTNLQFIGISFRYGFWKHDPNTRADDVSSLPEVFRRSRKHTYIKTHAQSWFPLYFFFFLYISFCTIYNNRRFSNNHSFKKHKKRANDEAFQSFRKAIKLEQVLSMSRLLKLCVTTPFCGPDFKQTRRKNNHLFSKCAWRWRTAIGNGRRRRDRLLNL